MSILMFKIVASPTYSSFKGFLYLRLPAEVQDQLNALLGEENAAKILGYDKEVEVCSLPDLLNEMPGNTPPDKARLLAEVMMEALLSQNRFGLNPTIRKDLEKALSVLKFDFTDKKRKPVPPNGEIVLAFVQHFKKLLRQVKTFQKHGHQSRNPDLSKGKAASKLLKEARTLNPTLEAGLGGNRHVQEMYFRNLANIIRVCSAVPPNLDAEIPAGDIARSTFKALFKKATQADGSIDTQKLNRLARRLFELSTKLVNIASMRWGLKQSLANRDSTLNINQLVMLRHNLSILNHRLKQNPGKPNNDLRKAVKTALKALNRFWVHYQQAPDQQKNFLDNITGFNRLAKAFGNLDACDRLTITPGANFGDPPTIASYLGSLIPAEKEVYPMPQAAPAAEEEAPIVPTLAYIRAEDDTPLPNTVPEAVRDYAQDQGRSAVLQDKNGYFYVIAKTIGGEEVTTGQGAFAKVKPAARFGPNGEALGLVAVKKQAFFQGDAEGERQMFAEEADQLGQIHHPNVVQVLVAGEVERKQPLQEKDEWGEISDIQPADLPRASYFIVEDYVPMTIDQFRERCQATPNGHPPALFWDIATQALQGMQAVHDAGQTHSDPTPGNIGLTEDGTVKLLDFGKTLGTPEFSAPEIADGDPITPAADIWALGATLLYLTTHANPNEPNWVKNAFADAILETLNTLPPEDAKRMAFFEAFNGLGGRSIGSSDGNSIVHLEGQLKGHYGPHINWVLGQFGTIVEPHDYPHLHLIANMIAHDPDRRSSATELLENEYLRVMDPGDRQYQIDEVRFGLCELPPPPAEDGGDSTNALSSSKNTAESALSTEEDMTEESSSDDDEPGDSGGESSGSARSADLPPSPRHHLLKRLMQEPSVYNDQSASPTGSVTSTPSPTPRDERGQGLKPGQIPPAMPPTLDYIDALDDGIPSDVQRAALDVGGTTPRDRILKDQNGYFYVMIRDDRKPNGQFGKVRFYNRYDSEGRSMGEVAIKKWVSVGPLDDEDEFEETREELAEVFKWEARRAQAVSGHPAFPAVYAGGEVNRKSRLVYIDDDGHSVEHNQATTGSFFIVMEAVDGSLLFDLLNEDLEVWEDNHDALGLQLNTNRDAILPWVGHLMHALVSGHQHLAQQMSAQDDVDPETDADKIYNGDGKPDNMMVTSGGHVKIIDLGIGGATPGFAPPERLKDNTISEKGDVFSFGVIVLEILTGQSCDNFIDETTGKLSDRNVFNLIQDSELRDLLQRMVSEDPNDRPSFEALLAHPILVEARGYTNEDITKHWAAFNAAAKAQSGATLRTDSTSSMASDTSVQSAESVPGGSPSGILAPSTIPQFERPPLSEAPLPVQLFAVNFYGDKYLAPGKTILKAGNHYFVSTGKTLGRGGDAKVKEFIMVNERGEEVRRVAVKKFSYLPSYLLGRPPQEVLGMDQQSQANAASEAAMLERLQALGSTLPIYAAGPLARSKNKTSHVLCDGTSYYVLAGVRDGGQTQVYYKLSMSDLSIEETLDVRTDDIAAQQRLSVMQRVEVVLPHSTTNSYFMAMPILECDLITIVEQSPQDQNPFTDLLVPVKKGTPNPLSLIWARELVEQAKALQDASVVHRDLKSENVMTDKDGHAKMMDFAYAAEERTDQIGFKGTAEFAPPEVLDAYEKGAAIPYSNKSDVFALVKSLGGLALKGNLSNEETWILMVSIVEQMIKTVFNNDVQPVLEIFKRHGLDLQLDETATADQIINVLWWITTPSEDPDEDPDNEAIRAEYEHKLSVEIYAIVSTLDQVANQRGYLTCVNFFLKGLAMDPSKRATATDLLRDPWLTNPTPPDIDQTTAWNTLKNTFTSPR